MQKGRAMNVELATNLGQQNHTWSPMSLPLSNMALFANVEPEAIEGLLEACPRRELAEGSVLIRRGETNRTLYLILDGRLRVHLDSPDNPPLVVLESGESVGELSVIDHKPASAWVVADTAAVLLAVDQERFWSLVHASHAVACNMLGILAQRLRQSDAAISEGQRLQRIYKRHATTDELTGLYNRRWIQNLLRRHLMRCSMNRQPLSVLFGGYRPVTRFQRRVQSRRRRSCTVRRGPDAVAQRASGRLGGALQWRTFPGAVAGHRRGRRAHCR